MKHTIERIPSYSSIFALGHKALGHDFLTGPVLVEEKIDGSQFSFAVDHDGRILVRSKGKEMHADAPEKMFEAGVEQVKAMADDLTPGWVYRGEYLQKPKHNTIAYGRIPSKHIILFDVDRGGQDYLNPDEKRTEAYRLGLEVVPTFHEGTLESLDHLQSFLQRESCLGAANPEGFVLKRYDRFGDDKKTLMAKYVTEAFKETHEKEWKAANPSRMDVVQSLIVKYRTTARWQKAVQHLREAGALTGSPRDIGALLKEIPNDVRKECEADIKDALFAYAWPHIQRGVTNGVAQWYKDELAKEAFQ